MAWKKILEPRDNDRINVSDYRLCFYNAGFKHLILDNAVGNIASRRIKEKTGCVLIDVKSEEFVDPVFTENELWELTIENWEKHKLLKSSKYVEVEY